MLLKSEKTETLHHQMAVIVFELLRVGIYVMEELLRALTLEPSDLLDFTLTQQKQYVKHIAKTDLGQERKSEMIKMHITLEDVTQLEI